MNDSDTDNELSAMLNRVFCMDCFDLMARLPDKSIDAIITDLPYGTTACSWDTVIPFAPMWDAVKRILKPRGVFVTTASQPFTSALVMSNPGWYRYQWIWHKDNSAGFALVNMRPFQVTEDVLVFGKSGANYYPIMDVRGTPRRKGGYSSSKAYGIIPSKSKSNVFYPKNLLRFPNADQTGKEHPTQKPVALYDYLIRTYTQPGEIVLDFCAGSGTTAIAARNTARQFIIGDSSAEYVAIAERRLSQPFTLPMLFEETEAAP